MCIQMNNNNTSLPNANTLNLDDGYNHWHIETPSISQISSQNESYRSQNITKTVPRQNPTITKDELMNH